MTAIYEPVENGWYQGRIKELPEVVTAAPTLEEAREYLDNALHLYVSSLQADGLPIPVRIENVADVVPVSA